MKKVISEEIGRISQLMGVEPKLIAEQATLLKKVGDELWRFVKKAQKGFTQDQVDDVILKGRRNGVDSLTDKELQTLLKHIDLKRLAEKYYDDGLVVSKNSLNSTITNQINKLKQDGASSYSDLISGIQDSARKDFFGLIPGFKSELNDFADAFANKLIDNLNETIKQTNPTLWDDIVKTIRQTQKVGDSWTLAFKKFLDDLSMGNIQTLSRVLTRSLKKQENLREEFINTSKEMANAIANGKTTLYYEKKLTDILTASKKGYNDSIENIYRMFKQDPDFPKGQMPRDFETSGNYIKLMDAIKDEPRLGKFLIEDLKAWGKLIKIGTWSEFFQAWWNIVLKVNPVSFEQIVKRLQQRGLKSTFINQVIGAYIAKYLVIPTVYTIYKGFLVLLGEVIQWGGGLIGLETPLDPKQSGPLWTDIIKENFLNAIPKDLRLVLPWNSLLDEIIVAAIENNPKAAEDYLDKTIPKDVKDGAEKIKEGKIDEIKEVSIEEDLKALIPQEFHQYLGRKLDGTYELKNPKKGESYKIYKENGVWGVEAEDKNNQVVLLPLENSSVISSIEAAMR
jgi:hypothetical protein